MTVTPTPPAAADLSSRKEGLSHVETKIHSSEDSAAAEAFEKLYNEHSTDLKKLAELTGSSVEKLTAKPPAGATEFSTNLLAGRYE